MLKLLSAIFHDLDAQGVDYAVYKGLSHLADDLAGNGGDIDIVIALDQRTKFHDIVTAHGLQAEMGHNGPYYYFGLDQDTHKTILLDVVDKLYMGPKSSLQYSVDIDLNAVQCARHDNVRVFNHDEYICTLIVMGTLRGTLKSGVFEEIKTALQDTPPSGAYIYQNFIKPLPFTWQEIVNDLRQATRWQDFCTKYRPHIVSRCAVDRLRQLKSCVDPAARYIAAFKRRILKRPRYRLRRRGFLVAFIGVDGAGKTSTIDYIEKLDFFKRSGIKTMYFGNNAYWIPFLDRALKKHAETFILKNVFFAIAQIDKQFRIIGALFYMFAGNIVLADRYFYDQKIDAAYLAPKKKKHSIVSFIGFLLRPRMWRQPDITIFLDVSPEIAQQRKQDYSFDKMLEVNKAYKDYMTGLHGVRIVNADQAAEKVHHEAVEIIREYTCP